MASFTASESIVMRICDSSALQVSCGCVFSLMVGSIFSGWSSSGRSGLAPCPCGLRVLSASCSFCDVLLSSSSFSVSVSEVELLVVSSVLVLSASVLVPLVPSSVVLGILDVLSVDSLEDGVLLGCASMFEMKSGLACV